MRGLKVAIGTLLFALIVSVAPSAWADSPPHVVITAPDAGATVSGTVTVAGNAWDDVHVVMVKVHIDSGEWWDATDTSGNDTWYTWETSWDTTAWANGWHHVGALAKDGSGQMADASIEVYVHNEPGNQPPWVTIETPAPGSTVRDTVTVGGLSGDEDDNDTVEMVQYKIDDGDWVNATPRGDNGSFGHWSFDWNTTLYTEGWHVVRARAFDGEAWGDDKAAEYFVDNEPEANRAPFAEILHPENGATVSGIVLIHGVAGDPDEGDRVELVEVRIGDRNWTDAVDTSHDDSWSTWAFQWDTTEFDDGERTICARAFDGELYSAENCRTVKVNNAHENHRPTVQILHPVTGQKVSGIVLIHGKAWDDVLVKLVEIRFNDGDWHHTVDTSPDDTYTTWAYEWNTKERDDGCLHIGARAWDGSLFSEVHTIEVCVDNVNDRPKVHITDPENEETVHGLVLIHGTASDDHQVKRVDVKIDGHEWDEASNTGRERPWSTWAYEWNTMEVENGKHRVCARSWDGELFSEAHCITVIVHNEPDGGYRVAGMSLGNAGPFAAAGLLSTLGVATLMWLRRNGYLRT
jgi:hypothetical protein